MPAVVVTCPKCTKRQEVGVAIPPEGLRYACVFCQAAFMVRLPPVAAGAPPPHPPATSPPFAPAGPPQLSSDFASDLGHLGSALGAPAAPAAPPAFDAPPLSLDLPPVGDPIGGAYDDLLASRDAVPRPGDLLASRDAVPRPDDLLASRDAVPRPGDLLASRDSMPRPGDVLASRDVVPRPGDVLAPKATSGSKSGANLPGSGIGLDLFSSGELPKMGDSPLPPLELEPAVDGPGGPPDLGVDSAANPDLGFSLELEHGQTPAATQQNQAPVIARPPPGAVGQESVPKLAPHAAHRERQPPTVAPKDRRKLLLGLGVGAAVVAAGVAAWTLVVMPMLKEGPKPTDVLVPLAADLARDHYPAYQQATELLLQAAADKPEAVKIRAAAAEHVLLAVVARGGERAKIARAEQIIGEIKPPEGPEPDLDRTKALLALAKGKLTEIEAGLQSGANTPEAQLVRGLRALSDGKRDAALTALRAYQSGRPDRLLGTYLVARALEESKRDEAAKIYKEVVAKNGDHVGAALALIRLGDAPLAQLAAAEDLIKARAKVASPGELADAHVVMGNALQALGRTAEAQVAYGRALGIDAQHLTASLSLGELQIYDGRYQDALGRLRATGSAGLKTAAGKFGIGGALIASGKPAEGEPLVVQAAKENPKDPRGPFWMGTAAETSNPTDAEARYREALSLDPRFLPASLKLAALLQRQGKAEDALAVLRAAEEAGAPPTALQIAWGEALVQARQPDRAVEVFQRAIELSPKLAPAHFGLASAFEAQGNLQGAKATLEKMLVNLPEVPALRERLAAVCLKLDLKDEALAHYKAEIATGKATPALRVTAAKLALDMKRLDDMQPDLHKLLEDHPTTPDGFFTLARFWEARGELGKALMEYRRALNVESGAPLNLAYGRALLRAGKEQEAMTAFDTASSLPEALLERGRVNLRRGDYDRALADFEAAVRLDPKNSEAALLQGSCHYRLGNSEKAAEAWRLAVKLQPDLAEAHFELGRQENDRGRPKNGIEHLRRAKPNLPVNGAWLAEFYYQLGSAELIAGSKTAAADAFKTYAEIAPPDAPARPEVERHLRTLGVRR